MLNSVSAKHNEKKKKIDFKFGGEIIICKVQ